jgi:pentatricopeptide repeat protein
VTDESPQNAHLQNPNSKLCGNGDSFPFIMRFSTIRPPLTGFSAILAWVVLLCTVHVWNAQAFSRDTFPSPRTTLIGPSGSVTTTHRRLHGHGHDSDLDGSLTGFNSRRRSMARSSSTMLHVAPSKKTTAPSVPPTPTNATSQNANNPTAKASAATNSRSNLLQDLRSRHTTGEKLTQEYCDSVVAWCVAQDEWDSVLDVLDIMKSQGLYQVRSTYTACLRACLDVPNAASAKEILTAMEQAGIPPGAQDIALTVAAMCRQEKTEKGWWKKALQLVLVPPTSTQSSSDSNITEQLPVQSYDAVLSCMSDDRQWQEAARLLRRMEQGLAPPAVSTYRLVIECCVKSQQAEQALQVLQSCVKHGLVPTVYSFEIVISALSKKLQWRQAVQLLDVMDDLNIPKTLLIYNTLLSACSKAREVVQAKNLLVQMRKSGIQPNVMSYNSVMSACASTNRWKDALAVLDQCHRTPGVAPDVYTYTIAMRACAKGM